MGPSSKPDLNQPYHLLPICSPAAVSNANPCFHDSGICQRSDDLSGLEHPLGDNHCKSTNPYLEPWSPTCTESVGQNALYPKMGCEVNCKDYKSGWLPFAKDYFFEFPVGFKEHLSLAICFLIFFPGGKRTSFTAGHIVSSFFRGGRNRKQMELSGFIFDPQVGPPTICI